MAGAIAFLTRVPIGRWVVLDAADVARGGAVFPLVGAGVGAAVGAVASLDGQLSAPLAATLGVALGAVVTGALHLDALADTADALGASTRERALAIMRDHQIGAYGAAALVFDVGIKIAAVAVLATRGDAVRACAAAVAVSRVVPVVLGVALPYARAGEGLGRALTTTGWGRALVAVAIGAIVAAVLGFAALLGVAAASAVVVGLTARAWLGGVTGDILGASAELTELAALVAAVVLT